MSALGGLPTTGQEVLRGGVLVPDGLLTSDFVAVLAAFVAMNTVIYVTLAVAKLLPKIYLSDWVNRRDRRSETRSIHPDDPI